MASVNKVILVGNLGADPELRYTSSGTPVATFSLATREQWTNKNGEKTERTEWHRIVAWARLGEICGEYLHKGKQVYVEGRLHAREWQTQDGQNRTSLEVTSSNVVFLGRPSGGAQLPDEGDIGPDEMPFDQN